MVYSSDYVMESFVIKAFIHEGSMGSLWNSIRTLIYFNVYERYPMYATAKICDDAVANRY